MDGLKVIANEILPVYQTSSGEKVVNAREVHEKLLVGKDFTTWIKDRLEKYGFVPDEDYILTLTKIGERSNVTRHDYFLSLDTAKEISMVQNNEMGRAIRKYFIAVEKRFREQQPKSQLEILQASINQLVEQEQRLSVVEKRLIETEKKQDNLSEIISLNNIEWRKKVNGILQRIAKAMGGFEAYRDIRNESYKVLEQRAACKLSVRLTNKKQKMAFEGVAKSKIDKATKMDVIADDGRLTEIYLAIVKEMAIKYKVDLKEA